MAEPLFHVTEKFRKDKGDQQINNGDQGIGLKVKKRLRGKFPATAQDISRLHYQLNQQKMSKASVDLPEPESPVKTTRLLRGKSTSIFFRLCIRAPRILKVCGSMKASTLKMKKLIQTQTAYDPP